MYSRVDNVAFHPRPGGQACFTSARIHSSGLPRLPSPLRPPPAMSRPAPTSPACAPELASLALAFRDAAERHDYAARHPDFLPWLQDVVRHRVRATDDGVAELCKLVANFVADEGAVLQEP